MLEASLNVLLQRHAILRTTFALRAGQPVQVIAPSLVLPLLVLDLSTRPLEERERLLQQRIAEEIAQPFDLEHGPLQRYLLLHLSEEEHVLFLLWHHSISDGWSEEVFLRELSEVYTASRAGKAPDLAPVTLQYADYALWQRQHTAAFEPQLEYWREHLAGAPPQLELPPIDPDRAYRPCREQPGLPTPRELVQGHAPGEPAGAG
ncbi:condensation domain-containing protein, partial [Nostoc sp. 'Peltigera malacea cyanobiont' DB3992]|uniref:condensation domain-containing protein n=1 Tax=Nostoc sp. 'Peltigera malacea cyanobiont' DB3992 TaxID=1206980 RepID=UPI00211E90E3